jgi:hypothetical protein
MHHAAGATTMNCCVPQQSTASTWRGSSAAAPVCGAGGVSSQGSGGAAQHLRTKSLPPGKFLICHTNADFSGTYTAEPWWVLAVGAMASGGSGMMISTLVALLRSLNWLLALTWYCVRLLLGFSTRHSTQISGLERWVHVLAYWSGQEGGAACAVGAGIPFTHASDNRCTVDAPSTARDVWFVDVDPG